MRNLVLSSLLLLSCSTMATTPREHGARKVECKKELAFSSWDPRTEVFLEQFFQGARDAGTECYKASTISFASSKEVQKVAPRPDFYILGYCTSDGHIVLNQDAWDRESLIKNKAVLFHELGHCVFLLDHAPEDSINLMAPSIPGPLFLSENWQEMLRKLFQKSLSLGATPDVFFNRHTMY